MDVLRCDFLFCSVNTPVTLICPAMPIYDPPPLEDQTSQQGTLALLAE